jgi:hypothetical protein
MVKIKRFHLPKLLPTGFWWSGRYPDTRPVLRKQDLPGAWPDADLLLAGRLA